MLALTTAAHAQVPVPGPQEPTPDDPVATLPSSERALPPTSDDFGGQEIVVTAQKRAQTLSDVPVSVTALTGAQLVSKGINDVQDLVKVTPGLSFADTGKAAPIFSLRGVGFFDNTIGARPTVSVYIDEAPLPFSIQAKAGSFDLERVEVLKGPQGTLFGQSSTGGAINYIAAKPTDAFSAGISASYGRFNMTDIQAHVSGPLTNTLNARIAVHTQQSSGWQYSYTRDDTIGSQNFTQGRLLLDWTPTDKLTVAVNVNGFYDGSENQAPQFIGAYKSRAFTPLLLTYPTAPAKSRAADWNRYQNFPRKNSFYQGVLRADYEVSDALTLTSLTSYSREHVNSYLSDGTTLNNFNVTDVGTVKSLSEELRASGDVGPFHYLVGANYQHDTTDELVSTLTAYATTTPIAGDDDAALAHQRFNTKAVFADATYNLAARVRLTAGIRYTRQDLDYSGCLTVQNQFSATTYTATINAVRAGARLGPIPTLGVGQCASLDANYNPALAVGSLDEDNVSWRAGLDFKPTPRTLLYANLSRGYKAGSISAPGASSIEQFRPVTQESVLAYEAGIKTSLFDRVLDVTAAGFYYDYDDKQLLGRNVFTPNIFGAQSALVNIPKSRIIGAEAQATVRPARSLSLTAAATYLDTKIKGDFVNYSLLGIQANFRGSAFPYTPKWQLVFDAEERPRISPTLNGLIAANANYRSATTAGFGGDPRLNIDSYWLVDVRLGVEAADGRWSATLYGRNIFDKYYWNNVAAGGDTRRRYSGMTATYCIQLSFQLR